MASLSLCRFEAKKKLITVNATSLRTSSLPFATATTDIVMNQFHSCLLNSATSMLGKQTQKVEFESNIRTQVARSMENLTCSSDLQFAETPDVDVREWTSERDNKTRTVHVKLDRHEAHIHVVENFVNQEECEAVEAQVAGTLSIAVIEDGKGGVQVNKGRKALQAYLEPDWSKEHQDDPITALSRRIFEYASHDLSVNITEHGQEPLMSIQYAGRGLKDFEPDRYQPHCDGKCEGRPWLHASRVATMVIYCQIPDQDGGGNTNFQNADVTVKPTLWNGVFFSYVDPRTNITDKGWSQHSGCPVFQGVKRCALS